MLRPASSARTTKVDFSFIFVIVKDLRYKFSDYFLIIFPFGVIITDFLGAESIFFSF